MSVQLLDKTRKINKLLHNNNSHKVVFNDICEVLSEILVSNVLVISKKGKVLGIKDRADIETINELIIMRWVNILIRCSMNGFWEFYRQKRMSTWKHWDLNFQTFQSIRQLSPD